MTTDAFYYGCWNEVGHFLFKPDGDSIREFNPCFPKDFPVKPGLLDGAFLGCQWGPQFEAVLSHVGNWTIISFWDNTVDDRPGSNSNFIFRGKLSFEEAIKMAKEVFPTIFARFPKEIILKDKS